MGKSKVKFAHHETSLYFGGADLTVYLVIMFICRDATYDICCLIEKFNQLTINDFFSKKQHLVKY